MITCSLCNNKSGLFSYHRFPLNKIKKIAWLNAINLPNFKPGVYDRICSAHFEDKYLDKTSKDNRVRLRDDAVPTIFFSIEKSTSKKNAKSQLSTKNNKKKEVQVDNSIFQEVSKRKVTQIKPTTSQEVNKKKDTQIKQTRRIKIVDRTSLTLESVEKKEEQRNEKKEKKKENENQEELTTKLKLAEFRINQYEMAVSHLQTRLEGMAAQCTQLNNELKNTETKFKEEMLCKDLKIKQLESENEQLRNYLVKKQTCSVKEERILGP